MPDERDGQERELEEVEFLGGPLGGQFVAVDAEDEDPWIAIIADGCAYPGGRALYTPDERGRWVHERDLPPEAM